MFAAMARSCAFGTRVCVVATLLTWANQQTTSAHAFSIRYGGRLYRLLKVTITVPAAIVTKRAVSIGDTCRKSRA